MFTDLPEPALREYRSTQTDPEDFDEFWATTLAETRAHPLDLRVERVETGLTTVDVFDVTFAGWAGQPVRAWLRVPAGVAGPLPAVVQFVGYGGGRGAAVENLFWSSAGFAHLQMDTRGQGSGWSLGATPDPDGSGPAHPGVMTRGIDSRETYYYRRVFMDAVRAVEAARGLDVVDATRVSVVGGSQGGGIALAVAGLVPDLAAVAAYVPFLCDFRRATVITDADPYKEIGRYLAVHRHRASSVHEVLAYFDGVNFARRASAPALFTTALMDPTCPPSTVFGAFHAYAGPADVTVWPYNGHEGGGFEDDLLALSLFRGVRA
ncbi:acetylxylan esterase [Frigoribacterium sp. VKM Ac-2836]|uniref:acetylxylan esterase n=1 Tax=Frigoribacterium sp. VKM Ac-2836 TaxID=2739014 RepID=UPI0015654F23|nr:acetylxylan esterase [Frigoribacterium sp. VKM Ac-2836]NRD26170.1 acetylxylan esterase [Frigoribacterium sp. VKM Ac-2836]